MHSGEAQTTRLQSPQSHPLPWRTSAEPPSLNTKNHPVNWLNFTNSDYLRVKPLHLIKASLTVILFKNYLT